MVLRQPGAVEARLACGQGFLELCRGAATTSLAAVPADVGEGAGGVRAGEVAGGVGGAAGAGGGAVQGEFARGSGGAAAATVFGRTPYRVDRHSAAAANGLAICWTELDEGYRLV